MGIFLTVRDVRVRAASLTVAVLMGFSRLYVGVHNPTDVLAGALIGMAGAVLAVIIIKWIDEKVKTRQMRKEKQ